MVDQLYLTTFNTNFGTFLINPESTVAAPNTNTLNLAPGGSPSDEIELIMTDSNPFPNGQETRTYVQQSRKAAAAAAAAASNANASNTTTTTEKVTRPGSRSPDNNDTQEWVSFDC